MGVRQGYSESRLYWAVLIQRTDGTDFIGWAEGGLHVPQAGDVFKTKREAVAARKVIGKRLTRIARIRLLLQEVR